MTALRSYGLAYYHTDHPHGKFKGNEPWVVAGVAAMALDHCYYPIHDVPTTRDVQMACWMYFNLERPKLEHDALAFGRLVFPEIYAQWSYQRPALENLARPAALFDPRSWATTQQPTVTTVGWEQRLLGCSVAEFTAIGFVLYTIARNGGSFPLPDFPVSDLVYNAFGGKAAFDQIAERLYITDIPHFREERKKALAPISNWNGAERLTFNPLISRPLLRGLTNDDSGHAIAPVPETVRLRASVEGVIYEGLALYAAPFTQDVGSFFEGYVGRQLDTMTGAETYQEITYRGPSGSDRKTVDWFVILPSAVVLVECKSALPNRSVVEGRETFAEGHQQTISARKQILATAELIRNGQPELSRIPTDRPMVGLVVTLGTYYGANGPEVSGESNTPANTPIGVIDAASLEKFVTLPACDADSLVAAMLSGKPGGQIDPRIMIDRLHWGPNRLLQEAYENLPVIKAVIEAADQDMTSTTTERT